MKPLTEADIRRIVREELNRLLLDALHKTAFEAAMSGPFIPLSAPIEEFEQTMSGPFIPLSAP